MKSADVREQLEAVAVVVVVVVDVLRSDADEKREGKKPRYEGNTRMGSLK